MKILTNVKENVKNKIMGMTMDDALAITMGAAFGLTIVCIGQQIQIDKLNNKVNTTCEAITKIAKTAYENDVKAYNNNLITSYAVEAIANCIKGTHPGVTEAVDKAIFDARMDFIS